MFVAPIKSLGLIICQIAATSGDFDVSLSFGGFTFGVVELADKSGLVSALSPCFRDIGGNGAGRPTHLVCQRKAFIGGKGFGDDKYFHREIHTAPPNFQFFVRSYFDSSPCLLVALSQCQLQGDPLICPQFLYVGFLERG